MMHGYNFTDRFRRVLVIAREEAARLHHEYVGTEHMLLGIVREGEGVAARVLGRLAVELDDVVHRVEQVVKPGRPTRYPGGPDLPYTSRAKRVLELAMTQARDLGHGFVGSEHLLLGLIAEEKGIAAQVLAEAGVTLEKARAELLKILGVDMPPQWLTPDPSPAYERIGAQRRKAVEKVDVVLHYRDGQQLATSFANVYDAKGFLDWIVSGA